jgi:hypothetical protein
VSGIVKLAYTHRDRDANTGVEGIDEAAVNWIGLDLSGEVGPGAGYYIGLGSMLYDDPITGFGTDGQSGLSEMGPLGVREAYMVFSPWTGLLTVKLGTFIPAWGAYQERGPAHWDFADLPLVYVHPAFRDMGWQNTGAALALLPLAIAPDFAGSADAVTFTIFAVNGYFPSGLANAEAPFAELASMKEIGLGSRLALRAGPLRFYGGYYFETFGRDMRGDARLESFQAASWIAGLEARGAAGFLLMEWRSLLIPEYQLMTDGAFTDLESVGGFASGGINVTDRLSLLARLEWLDPNTADSGQTLADSRHDQIAQWTFGMNYQPADSITLKFNYVLPDEQGDRVDVFAGRVGGPYTERDNNYLRFQVEMGF